MAAYGLASTLADGRVHFCVHFAAGSRGSLAGSVARLDNHLEGIVAKRLAAPYEPGRRSGAWSKHKHRRRETFAVTGWRPAARRPDAIFVDRTTPDGDLRPAGTAGLGLTGLQREQLRTALHERSLDTRRGAHRVAAGIWVDVDFHGAETGPLRDAVMRAVRVDG